MKYRVEDKYQLDENSMILLEKRLAVALHTDKNQEDNQGYIVSSLYFDDLMDRHLHDTIDGVAQREKYRIRIYNHSLNTIKLEVKHKKYNRVWKSSRNITIEQMEQLIRGKCIDDPEKEMHSPITLFNLAIKERGLRPKIIIEYNRKAFLYSAGNVRITFDRDVRASVKEDLFGTEIDACQLVKPYASVLEVKYDEFLPDVVAQLLEIGNMLQIPYSKYRIGRECMR